MNLKDNNSARVEDGAVNTGFRYTRRMATHGRLQALYPYRGRPTGDRTAFSLFLNRERTFFREVTFRISLFLAFNSTPLSSLSLFLLLEYSRVEFMSIT